MMLKNKIAMIAGTAVVAGGLLTGVAFAASAATSTTPSTAPAASAAAPADKANLTPEQWKAQHEADEAARLAQDVKDGKITQAQADVMTQLDALRDAAMDKVQTDSKALIDQAVKDGKITQDQADQMQAHGGPGGFGHGGPGEFGHGPKGGRHGHGPQDGGAPADQAAPQADSSAQNG